MSALLDFTSTVPSGLGGTGTQLFYVDLNTDLIVEINLEKDSTGLTVGLGAKILGELV